jgi:hypothetical protein
MRDVYTSKRGDKLAFSRCDNGHLHLVRRQAYEQRQRDRAGSGPVTSESAKSGKS